MPNPRSDITPPRCTQNRFLYIYLDEAGDFNFSPNGTRCFTLSSIAKERLFHAYKELIELKYDLIESGTSIEYFHASEDKQTTRDRVFKIIQSNLTGIRVGSLIVEKRKTAPALRAEERFYPEMLGYLLRHVIKHHNLSQYSEVIVFTDRIPVQRKRQAVEKAVKVTLAKMLRTGVRYRVLVPSRCRSCRMSLWCLGPCWLCMRSKVRWHD